MPKRLAAYLNLLVALGAALVLVYRTATSAVKSASSEIFCISNNRPNPTFFGYTSLQPDGNRLICGRGSLPDTGYVDIPLTGKPHWIVAAPWDSDSLWVVVSDDGRVEAFRVVENLVKATTTVPDQLPPGMPPLLSVKNNIPKLIIPSTPGASPLTHPVILENSGRLVFVEVGGDVVVWDNGEIGRFSLNALPDARLLMDKRDRLLLLTDATTRYSHGVLGDTLEAASVSLIDAGLRPHVIVTISLPSLKVVEGIAPIWADITGDGAREIIVTVSDAKEGAQVLVFNEAGEKIAAGPSISRGYRWRHQLTVAPFGPGGELELVDVLTPHLGGVVEFYQLKGKTLQVVAQLRGYTSHVLGSRNLDMAAAGDFDGDGRVELLVPDQTLTHLGAIRHTAAGAEIGWSLELGGRLSTNLAAIRFANGTMAVGAGREDKVLRIWLP